MSITDTTTQFPPAIPEDFCQVMTPLTPPPIPQGITQVTPPPIPQVPPPIGQGFGSGNGKTNGMSQQVRSAAAAGWSWVRQSPARMMCSAACLGLLLLICVAGGGSSASSGQRDERLVGQWRHTDTYVSGTFTSVIDSFFVLNDDGTYERYSGSAAAGDGGQSLLSGGRSSGVKGTWRTEGKTLYLAPENSGEWTPEGTYSANDTNWMANHIVWERI